MSGSHKRPDRRNGRIRYVRLWVRDLTADTCRLSPAALGAYVRIFLACIAGQDAHINDEDARKAVSPGTTRRAWVALRAELVAANVLELVDGRLYDPRVEPCLTEFRAASTRNTGNVQRRWAVVGGLRDAQS